VAIRTAANLQLAQEVAFVWGNPNEQSHPGGFKTGASDSASVRYFVQPTGQFRETLRRARANGSRTPEHSVIEAESAAEVLLVQANVAELLQARRHYPDRLMTATDLDYLRWRYSRFECYRAVTVDSSGGGLAIFRLRRYGPFWGADICELLVEEGDLRTTHRLLGGIRRATSADFLVCAFTSFASAASYGFFPSGRASMLATLAFEPGPKLNPAVSRSWALSRGDLELL
jgi:hypothetical protein